MRHFDDTSTNQPATTKKSTASTRKNINAATPPIVLSAEEFTAQAEAIDARYKGYKSLPISWWSKVHSQTYGQQFIHGDIKNGQAGAASRLRVRYYLRPDASLCGSVYFGPETEGAPGLTHGGSQFAILDEASGIAVWSAGTPCLAGELRIRYTRPLPICTWAFFDVHVVGRDGGKVSLAAILSDE
eukprot:UC1_evm1s925